MKILTASSKNSKLAKNENNKYECTMDQQLADGISGSVIRMPLIADQTQNPLSAIHTEVWWTTCCSSVYIRAKRKLELLHFVLWVRKRELWQFLKRKRYKNKNYSWQNERKRELLQTKKRKRKIWANHTAILCQPHVTQQYEPKMASI